MSRAAALFLLLWAHAPAQAAPRLLVVVSVDQMRADYLDRYQVNASSGFKELFEHGALFTNAQHSHVPTETGPGHAVILTGKYPGETGIVGNDWYDRRASTTVYCVADAVHGLGPQNLETYTLGDALKAKDPQSRVVSVSLKDRAAILMGGKKADAAIWFNASNGEFVSSSYYGAKPAWLDAFNARLKKGVLARFSGRYGDFRYDSDADRAVLDLAEQAVLENQLGEDAHPDILAVSFSATDYIGHKWGPDSPQMKSQMARLDGVIGELLGFLSVQVGRDNFDLALTADHGVLPTPESKSGKDMGARRVPEDEVVAKIEETLQALHPAAGQKWLTVCRFPHLYLNWALAQKQGLVWSSYLHEAAAALRKIDALAQVYIPWEWEPADLFTEAYERSYFPGRSGDLIVRQVENVLLSSDKTSTDHGSPYLYDTHVPLIFFGKDFKIGLFAREAKISDLAPTCAKALGVDFPPTAGSRVLKEILAAP